MRILLILIALLFPAAGLQAAETLPLGKFQVINSGGFIEVNGDRKPLDVDLRTREVTLRRTAGADLILSIDGSDIILYEIEDGLAALTWSTENSSLINSADVFALSRKSEREEVSAWGANLGWPQLGEVQLVLMPLRNNAYTGFLISHPGANTVVRQMEFRQVFGPLNRPETDIKAAGPAPKAEMTN